MGGGAANGHHESDRRNPIENKKFLILALGIAALVTLGKAGGVLPAIMPPSPATVTRCAQVEAGSVDGFVSNQGTEPYRLRGEVRFVFTSGGAPSRPDVLVQADVELSPGKPLQVARAKLSPPLRQGEECRLDIQGALLKD